MTNDKTSNTVFTLILTIAAHHRSGGILLSTSPFTLKSYAKWKLKQENIDNININAHVFPNATCAEEITEYILASNADVVGLSMYIWNYSVLRESAMMVKKQRPDIKILFGGPQVSPIAAEIINNNWFVDIIPYLTVPGENIFFNVLKAVSGRQDLNRVNNIYYREGTQIIKTLPANEEVDLEQSPSPLLDGTIDLNGDNKYQIVLESSRGCFMECAYCFWSGETRHVRYFPLERVLAEIDKVYSNPQVTHVIFADSDVLMNRERTNTLIDKIKTYGSRISTFFEVDAIRITESNRDIVEKISSLDRSMIKFAIQSANPETLRIMKRPFAFEKYAEKAALVRSWIPDVAICVEIIASLPGDTLSTFIDTIDASLSLEPAHIHTNYPLYLLPGTDYFINKSALGITHTGDPNYTIIETATFPKKDIITALHLAFFTEILTFYHPILAKTLYRICRKDQTERRVDRLARWMTAIENCLGLLTYIEDVVVKITENVDSLNEIKGDFLHAACSPNQSAQMYQAILDLEGLSEEALDEFSDGIKVYKQISNRPPVKGKSPYENLEDLFLIEVEANSGQIGLQTARKFVPRFVFDGRV